MQERPILFSGEMIRAILDGRKTQTRRIARGVFEYDGAFDWKGHRWGALTGAPDAGAETESCAVCGSGKRARTPFCRRCRPMAFERELRRLRLEIAERGAVKLGGGGDLILPIRSDIRRIRRVQQRPMSFGTDVDRVD